MIRCKCPKCLQIAHTVADKNKRFKIQERNEIEDQNSKLYYEKILCRDCGFVFIELFLDLDHNKTELK